jgi:hypothetical protein
MLTYRLTGTTEHSGSTTTNPTTLHPDRARPQAASGAESSRTMLRLEDGAALLTWDNCQAKVPLDFASAVFGHTMVTD